MINQFLTLLSGKKAKFLLAYSNHQDLKLLKTWIEAGKIQPIIDRVYNLSEIVLAHTYSEQGHTVGKIVLEVGT